MMQRPTIPRAPALPPAQDWEALRDEGLRHIQALSGLIWTDHNSHDPGITTLEVLCFALADLAYRMDHPTADLLTGPDGRMDPPEVSGLIPAHVALPTAPRTAADYRRLLLRIEGLANAWAVPRPPGRAEVAIHADRLAQALSFAPVNAAGQANPELRISGLWDIFLDLEPDDRLGVMNDPGLEMRVTAGPLKGVVLRLDCLAAGFAAQSLAARAPRLSHQAAPVQPGSLPGSFRTALTLTLGPAPGQALPLADCLIRVVEDRPRPDRAAIAVTAAEVAALLADQGADGLVARFWDKQLARTRMIDRVTAALSANRGLCEDFATIAPVPAFPVALCADVDLAPDADVEAVQAAVFHAVATYLAPPLRLSSLADLLAAGTPVDTVWNGPFHDLAATHAGLPLFTRPGFLTDADLARADLRTAVQVSDIVNLVMDIPGVVAIRGISLRGHDALGLPDAQTQAWTLAVPPGHRATFHAEASKVLFHRAGIPYRPRPAELERTLAALRAEALRDVHVPPGQTLPAPQGRWRALTDLMPVQHDFPETYGIGRPGLSPSEPPARIAAARQFKAYLTVFEQVLADYLAQLAGLRRLFSLDPGLRQTWFSLDLSQAIAGTAGPFGAEAFVDLAAYRDDAARARLSETDDAFLDRRNRLLDHLIARFAERFADYATLLMRIEDDSLKSAEELIADKLQFLRDWPGLSRGRGQGADLAPEDAGRVWNSANVSGLELRAGRLLGIADLRRRDLACAGHAEALFAVRSIDGGLRVIVPAAQGARLFVSDQTFPTREEALAAARAAHGVMRARGGIVVGLRQGTQRFEITLMVPGAPLTHRAAFDTAGQATAAARALIDRYDALLVSEACNAEGMHLIEHLPLRPRAAGDPLMPVCLPEGADLCGEEDPYSFRASVVLPYWPRRFRDMNFRALVERTLREEAPAHVQLRICWAGLAQMTDLDAAHRAWLQALRAGDPAARRAAAARLIGVLSSLSTVYPAATLHDCDLAEDARPVRLGSTALGIF